MHFPTTPPPRAPRAVVALLSLAALLPAALFAALIAWGPAHADRVLPPPHAAAARGMALYVREEAARRAGVWRAEARRLYEKSPLYSTCELGDVCRAGQERPLLTDGRPSSAVWDLPRHLMKVRFTDVQAVIPNAKVNYIWEEPLVVYYDNVLTEEEIDLMIDAASTRFRKSQVVDADGNGQEDQTRTSETAWIYLTQDVKYAQIVSKITALSGFTVHHAEHIGVNRYKATQYFNPHYDFMSEDQLSGGEFSNCQRAATSLVYLSDVQEGGQTMFVRNGTMDGSFNYEEANPDHLSITPKRGRVLIWYDMHPYTEKIDMRTLHGGAPVVTGTKLASTIFIRNCTRVPQEIPTPAPPAEVSSEEKKEL